jgi:glucose/arabinose dehydrogenase/mono/diheme cytochrome c family protein
MKIVRPIDSISCRYLCKKFYFVFVLAGLFHLYSCKNSKPLTHTSTLPAGQTASADGGSLFSADKKIIAKGQVLFEANCSACHNFLQKGIGPHLSEVTAKVKQEWLKKMIQNAPALVSSGDARAAMLFEEYKQVMPAFPALKEPDVESIMAFIHSKRKPETASAASASLGAPITDPMPQKIAKSGLSLKLDYLMTAPATAQAYPLARINKTLKLPGKKDRLFMVDLRGKLYEMVGKELRVFMDIAKEIPAFIPAPGLGTGLGSFAFHPDFYSNGLFYTTHTEKGKAATPDFGYADSIKVTLQWVLREWKVENPDSPTFSGKGRELFRVNMVSPIHGVQEVTFNPLAKPGSPDYGLLYIGLGDGGATENGYYFLCNDKSHVWSSVLRIDPRGTNSKNGHYGIPPENPFVKDAGAAGEVYCRGFRNPNRIVWTPDGKMLITDIGQSQMEEVNIGQAGADYGWPEREGTFVINHRSKMSVVYPLPPNDATFHYTYPAAQYDHDEGNAISGGFIYTSNAVPQLKEKYIFGDIANGRIFCVENSQLMLGQQASIQELELQYEGKPTTLRILTGNAKPDARMGEGLNGELYLFTKADGKIYQVSSCSVNE